MDGCASLFGCWLDRVAVAVEVGVEVERCEPVGMVVVCTIDVVLGGTRCFSTSVASPVALPGWFAHVRFGGSEPGPMGLGCRLTPSQGRRQPGSQRFFSDP